MSNFPDYLLNMLPPRARKKIDRLELEQQAAFAASRMFGDRVNDSIDRLSEAKRRESIRLAALPKLPSWASEEELAPIEAERRRIKSATEVAEEDLAHNRTGLANAQIRLEEFNFLQTARHWLDDVKDLGARHGLKLVDAALPSLKSTDHIRQVGILREQIGTLRNEWSAVEQAPVPRDQAIAAAIAEIDSLCAKGQPRVNMRVREGSPVRISEELEFRISNGTTPSIRGNATFLLTWAIRDILVEKVTFLIGQEPAEPAMSDTDRERELDRIAAKRQELERLEEAHICAAFEIGLNIPRRDDADPRAVLEIADVGTHMKMREW